MWVPAIASDCSTSELLAGEIAMATIQQPAGMWRDAMVNNTIACQRWYNHWNPEMISAGYSSPLD